MSARPYYCDRCRGVALLPAAYSGNPMERIVHEPGCSRVAPVVAIKDRPALGAHRRALKQGAAK